MFARVNKRTKDLIDLSNASKYNYIEYNSKDIGIIASGIPYYYAKEVFGDKASYFKIGFSYPMPMEKIKEFAGNVKKLIIIEELAPYIENHLKNEGVECTGKDAFINAGFNPYTGEYSVPMLKKTFVNEDAKYIAAKREFVVPRPPALCAGCPHRGTFYVLSKIRKKYDTIVHGDIGCYGLGAIPPFNAVDNVVCMGASISMAHGSQTSFDRRGIKKRSIAVIGDSTFYHTGINSLMNTAYNKGTPVVCILDNKTTAMTGHQENPGSGRLLAGKEVEPSMLEDVCASFGNKNITIVNPMNLKESEEALIKAVESDELHVIIFRYPCVMKKLTKQESIEFKKPAKVTIDEKRCTGCKVCLKTTGARGLNITEKKQKSAQIPRA
jgi:indolepyruvate ferredoxin oxidoreductase alpha subunit